MGKNVFNPQSASGSNPGQHATNPATTDFGTGQGRNSLRIGKFGSRTLLAIYALLIILPIVVVVFGSFKNQSQIILNPLGPPSKGNLEGYRKVISEHIFRALKNSVIVVALSVSLTLLTASLTAFAVTRLGGWRSNVLFGFFTLGMAVPAQVNGIQQYTMFKSVGLTNSLFGLVIVNMAVTLPVSVFILTGFMKTLPKELFEAGVVDGASPWRLYRSIAVPLSLPSIAAVAIFLFVMHWNDLYYPLLFITDESKWTLPRTLAQLRGEFLTDYPALFAGVVIASAPMVAAYVFLQRWFVAGLTSGAVKG
jgi:raffinose/stachyose/melibiose transport system permease protein